ncbi:MAG: DUF72 domain-containing protein [Gemmataceae bacterium]|nr:DUF72 domain-containing protein [Gemmataceae bacterium]MDW8266361.1 DUF72 domain-containing protein [Gemmataceae bacterium]
MQLWVGTSGFSYPDWVGTFYPAGLRPGHMLRFYARHFPLVELNFSFYRVPTADQLRHMADQVPAGFQFLVKLPRTLTHEARPDDLPAFRAAADALRQRGQLSALLAQLPQSVHAGPEPRRWLEHLRAELAGFPLAVEFRHRSWARADVSSWLRRQDIILVAVDVPDIPRLYPRGLDRSGPTVYVRFHSRRADHWYASDKLRYDYDYSDAELSEWVTALADEAQHIDRAYLLFNNCQRSHAVVNAQRMRQLLEKLGPGAQVVRPVAPVGPQRRTLFDDAGPEAAGDGRLPWQSET